MPIQGLDDILEHLPQAPGVYQYFDIQGQIIYIGKAKNIKKRVYSYFRSEIHHPKTLMLLRSIHRIEYILVESEHDALLLENNLIKKYQPKYNINLKDDKTFPYIVIKKEHFPRVYCTRQKKNDGATYLGPFTNIMATRFVVDFLKDQFPLRTCSLNLHPQKISQGHYKVCLEYHIKRCKAPCVGYQTEEDYLQTIEEIKLLMKHHWRDLLQYYKQQMLLCAEQLAFEQAHLYKKKIEAIEQFSAKSQIESTQSIDADVFAIDILNNVGLVHLMKVRSGKIIDSKNIQLEPSLDERIEDMLQFAIIQHYMETPREVTELIVPFSVYVSSEVSVTVPLKGDKKAFLDLALKNIKALKLEIRRLKLNIDDAVEKDKLVLLESLQRDLSLPQLPTHIECVDNSHFQGSYPVSALVCFRNGVPFKQEYRVFKIKTVKGIDDFATMREVIWRRYKRLKENNLPLPQLIIIDGGKGQLNAAVESLRKLDLDKQTTVIGLAKNQEEVFFVGDKDSLQLDYTSSSLKLLTQIRDEVHRFGVQFHRKLRERGTIKTVLHNIDGIGEFVAQKLLKHFGSVKIIKEQSEDDLAAVVGRVRASLIVHYFREGK